MASHRRGSARGFRHRPCERRAVPHFKPRVKRRSQSRDVLSFRLRYPLGPPATGSRRLPEHERADSQVR
eukprot:7091070-Prymnesium_polylepis.1